MGSIFSKKPQLVKKVSGLRVGFPKATLLKHWELLHGMRNICGFYVRTGIFFVLFLMFTSLAYAVVEIDGFVNDYADVISPEQEQQIASVLKRVYDSKEAEFVVVTVPSLEGSDIESYALEIVQGKLGDSETNNGLLLLVAVEDRKYRIEVGRGIEPVLNDAKVGRIGRTYLVEYFQNEEYGTGILEATRSLSSTFLDEVESEYYMTDAPRTSRNSARFQLIMFGGFLVMIVLSSIGGQSHRYRRRDRFFDAAMMAAFMFGGRGGRGGFGGNLGGGSGGISFGGGGFGGGGASGGW